MKRRSLRSALAALLLSAALPAQTTVVFQPDPTCSEDALISSLSPDNTYEFHHDFIACAWTNNSAPSNLRALVRFDLASLPVGITVQHATLELFHYNSLNNIGHSNLSGPDACWLERITQPWSPSTVTWSTQPATTIQNRVNVPASTSNSQNYSLDVTALVQDMLGDPGAGYGFMLRQQNESYYRSLLFASSDMPNPMLHPKLTVIFTPDSMPNAGCWQFASVTPDSTSSVTPIPSPIDPTLIMPNVFTPNGDLVNDLFFPDTTGIRVNSFTVFNRWGNEVFRSSPGTAWDGRDKQSSPCSAGTYYYLLEFTNRSDNTTHSLKGFFTLTR